MVFFCSHCRGDGGTQAEKKTCFHCLLNFLALYVCEFHNCSDCSQCSVQSLKLWPWAQGSRRPAR